MDISIIIVNYNVKYFLEQCLHSVNKSIGGLSSEIIVVDNNSVDGSCPMIKEKFPEVTLIDNQKNLGFSAANNQGIRIARGKYILILNPDTILQEDTLHKCFTFMESHPKAGSMGVKMIDGKGNYLPESKRSLPTPLVAFYKIFGLSALFPESKTFGRYHLGFLDKDKTHSIEILPGAFMFVRKSVLDEIGLLDETFFMYGEDIDLSYRIIKAGYQNYYFPETTIIHYKGESTKKGSINYVIVFYRAMIIFARKHFSLKNARLFSFFINAAIYLRAIISILRRVIITLIIPLTDATLTYLGFYFFKPYWEIQKFGVKDYYPNEYLLFVVPAYILIWLLFVYISGGYEKRVSFFSLFRGIAFGGLLTLLIYGLLPESLRFSRALLILGSCWAGFSFLVSRITFGQLIGNVRMIFRKQKKKIVIAGSEEEGSRVMSILDQVNIAPSLVGYVNWQSKWSGEKYMGDISQLEEIIKINHVDEIVFCAKEIPSQEIIQTMLKLGDTPVEFKIAPPESLSVIGSSSINTAGELYVVHLNTLTHNAVKRQKRIFDIAASILLILIIPYAMVSVSKPLGYVRNIVYVLAGFRSWVGLAKTSMDVDEFFFTIRPGIVSPLAYDKKDTASNETIKRLNLLYAKDYKILNDMNIMIRDFKHLGE
jgi:O-antigen biosynthesis protein